MCLSFKRRVQFPRFNNILLRKNVHYNASEYLRKLYFSVYVKKFRHSENTPVMYSEHKLVAVDVESHHLSSLLLYTFLPLYCLFQIS
jgi:hypothetical protein